ncbi:hypothetical protein FBU30_008083 [Linnemannia zychae]|nr:hypothetical protein FBU30_008083 [Linnemannia zychae]
MKFITSLAVVALAAVVSAQNIAINDPNLGGQWKAGANNYLRWSGTCKALGPAAKNVTVSLMTGPADRIRFVAELGTIDCSDEANVSTQKMIPADQEPGKYSLQINTNPISYSNIFDIVNPNAAPSTPAPAPQPATQTPAPAADKHNSASSLAAGSMVAAAGIAAAAFQLVF